MAQRYFITAESTYENLRQGLNEQLGYPNSLGKTIIQAALQAPRDGFRRVLLAIDTDLPNYAAIAAAIAPLLDSDAMEEIDEATYLAAVASATAGASSWNDITGKPTSFTPTAHKSTHATGGTDALSPADIGAAALSHTHSAADLTSGSVDIARLPVGTGSTQVAAGNDSRFTDQRVPTDGSVTDAKITSGGLSASSINWVAIQPWAANTAYAKGDLVSNAGIAYRRSAAGTSGATFNVANWQQITPSEFVGSQIASGTLDAARLPTSGVSAGTYTSVTVDTYGRVTAGTNPASGTKTYAVFRALDNQPPASNFATLDTRNSIAVLDFDDTTKETAVFVGVMSEAASLGSGLIVRLHWMATTATTNNCRWEVSLERSNTDLDSDSFDTVATGTTTTSGTSGIVSVTAITLTTIDGVTAGDLFRLRVSRDAANAGDTMTGDAELVAVEVRSAA